jgi:hypothetical protein
VALETFSTDPPDFYHLTDGFIYRHFPILHLTKRMISLQIMPAAHRVCYTLLQSCNFASEFQKIYPISSRLNHIDLQ